MHRNVLKKLNDKLKREKDELKNIISLLKAGGSDDELKILQDKRRKVIQRIRFTKHRIRDPKKVLDNAKKWRDNNPEKVKELSAEWYEKVKSNPEKYKKIRRERFKEMMNDPVARKEYKKKMHLIYKKRIAIIKKDPVKYQARLKRSRDYYAENRDRILEMKKAKRLKIAEEENK